MNYSQSIIKITSVNCSNYTIKIKDLDDDSPFRDFIIMKNESYRIEQANSFEIAEISTQIVNDPTLNIQNGPESPVRSHEKISTNSEKGKFKQKYFKGRNIIKKVKTHGIKLLITAIASCIHFKNSKKKKWKVACKKKIFKYFKSDISKIRNRQILSLPMKDILRLFSNINLNSQSFYILEEKEEIFNFLINIKWSDFLNLVKRSNKELLALVEKKKKNTLEVTKEDVREYVSYISEGGNHKERVNLDRDYLKLYAELESLDPVDINKQIYQYLTKSS